jgi:hypothetical protein
MSTESPAVQSEATTYTFSDRELERLAVYRAAVAASFYTDQCEAPETPGTHRRKARLGEHRFA